MDGERRWEGETDGATDLFKLTSAVASRGGWVAVTGADECVRYFDSSCWEPAGKERLGGSGTSKQGRRTPVFMAAVVHER